MPETLPPRRVGSGIDPIEDALDGTAVVAGGGIVDAPGTPGTPGTGNALTERGS